MKLLSLLMALCMGSILSAQQMRYVYELSYPAVSALDTQRASENMYLDIRKEGSVFRPENALRRDSLMQRMRDTRNFDRQQLQGLRSPFSFQVEKKYDSKKMMYQERIGRDLYQYEEDRPIAWQIHSETKKIGDYLAQKASTEFGGRHWDAWFTADVPVFDGPYKFSGLPGLIIKIEDHEGKYSFDLKEIRTLVEASSVDSPSFIPLKRAAFEAQKARFISDPQAFMGPMRRTGPQTGSPGARMGGRMQNDRSTAVNQLEIPEK